MKITESIERECCIPKDLRPYKGPAIDGSSGMGSLTFCCHCGAIWGGRAVREFDGVETRDYPGKLKLEVKP